MPLWGHPKPSRSSSSSGNDDDTGSGCTCICGYEKGSMDYSVFPPVKRKNGTGCSGAKAGDGKHCRRKGNGCYE